MTQQDNYPDIDYAKLIASCQRKAKWNNTRVAYTAGIAEAALEKFLRGQVRTLKGPAIVALMRELPGFAEELGFEYVKSRKKSAA